MGDNVHHEAEIEMTMERPELEHFAYWDVPEKGTECWMARHGGMLAVCNSREEAEKLLALFKREPDDV